MIEKIHEPISVELIFDTQTSRVYPSRIRWREQIYMIEKIGLHHWYYSGRILYHVFSVSTASLFFRLTLNTETLHWILEEVADGLPN